MMFSKYYTLYFRFPISEQKVRSVDRWQFHHNLGVSISFNDAVSLTKHFVDLNVNRSRHLDFSLNK